MSVSKYNIWQALFHDARMSDKVKLRQLDINWRITGAGAAEDRVLKAAAGLRASPGRVPR